MQRDKRHVHAEKLHWLGQHIRRDIADVGPLHIHDTLVGAQAPCQLAVSHIHSIDLDGTVLQHTVGKAARGRTDVHTDFAARGQREALHRLFQLESAPADVSDVVAANLDLGIFLYHLTSLVHLLLVDKDDTGHDESLGALTALDHTVLHQILVQTNFQSIFSPFGSAACLIWGTVAWGRLSSLTARWMYRPHQPASCRARARCSPMPPQAAHSSAIRTME